MKKIGFIILAMLLCIISANICLGATAKGPGADPEYTADSMPGVNWKMFDAKYWADDKDFLQELMTPDEIQAFNENCYSNPDSSMVKLGEMKEEFNGTKLRNSLASFTDPATHYISGKAVTASYYEAIRNNIRGSKVKDSMLHKYGICVNRSEIKSYPYFDLLSDTQEDPEWDDFVLSPLLINEPVVIYFASGDNKWYYVRSEIMSGWVPASDIAVCTKEDFMKVLDPANFLIVTGSSIRTEKTSLSDSASEMDIEMGTRLELCTEDPQMVHNRMSWYNYIVYIPVRNADGSYSKQKALIPVSRDVSTQYLKLTRGNILDQACKCLGNRYGWGGMMGGQDCSSFVRQVYLCFGMRLPRNTTMQSKMNCKKIDLTNKTIKEKQMLLDTLPLGSIVQFRGHEMLWIGEDEDEYYTLSDVSTLVLNEDDDQQTKYRVRNVIINGLNSTKRANGKTWMESIDLLIIPFEQ